MNCFEAKGDFVAFWQKTLGSERRGLLLTHLRGCATCDRSFRNFALTAPVLYSAADPALNSGRARESGLNVGVFNLPSAQSVEGYGPIIRTLNRVLPAFVMAAAAVLALYFAAPPRVTFEDAIADNTNAEVASYPSTDSFFGQEVMAQGTMVAEPAED